MSRMGLGFSLVLGCAAISGLLPGGISPARAGGPVYWDYPETFPFGALEMEGVALDRYGRLTPGLASRELLAGGPDVIWRTISDGRGGVYCATGHGGEVWHADKDGEAKLLAKLPEPEIFSLLRRGSDLFAGGGPDGLLYRISADGVYEIWMDLPEGYIWSMTEGAEGRLYLAVGSPAAIYVVTDRFEVERLAKLPAANALDVHWSADNELWAATQGPGLIYRIDPRRPGSPRLILESPQEEVRQFLSGPQGVLYALAISRQGDSGDLNGPGGGPLSNGNAAPHEANGGQEPAAAKAAIYRLDNDGLVTRFWRGDIDLMAVAYSETWGWLGSGLLDRQKNQTALLVLEPPNRARPLATWNQGDALQLLVHKEDGHEQIVVSLAHAGRVIRFEDRSAPEAVARSQPVAGLLPVRWGRLRWEGSAPKGSKILWSVRGGSRSTPDESWTDWSEPWEDTDHEIPLSPSRFMQWRAEFRGERGGAVIGAVSVSGFEPNLPPEILKFSLQPEGEIEMGGLMSRDENITETFRSGLKAEYSVSSRQGKRAPLSKAAPARPLRTFTWQAADPNDDRLVYRLEYQRPGEKSWRPVGDETRESLSSWDTSTVPDGLYVVRLVASDRLDNPGRTALETTNMCASLLVDHTAPTIQKFQVQGTTGGVKVSFEAADESGVLAEAWIVLPDGSSERLDPVDGICDSRRESFTAEIPFPDPGRSAPPEPWRVRVEVADRLGNVAAEEGDALR
jgi:hypothetical protein